METSIKTARTSNFRNNEHFQFHTEVRDLIIVEDPSTLKIKTQFSNYVDCYNNEDIALQKIQKSATTEEIDAADKERDPTYRGMVATNKAALNHYDPDVREAARKLQIIFDTFGNLATKPLNEETSGIYNLVQELRSNYAAEVKKVGLDGWLNTLDAQNIALDKLVKSRNDENALRTELKMKETRIETDRAYNTIVKTVNALIVVEGAAVYESFVRKLNSFVDKYNNILAQRQGRNKAKANSGEVERETEST